MENKERHFSAKSLRSMAMLKLMQDPNQALVSFQELKNTGWSDVELESFAVECIKQIKSLDYIEKIIKDEKVRRLLNSIASLEDEKYKTWVEETSIDLNQGIRLSYTWMHGNIIIRIYYSEVLLIVDDSFDYSLRGDADAYTIYNETLQPDCWPQERYPEGFLEYILFLWKNIVEREKN